MQKRELIATLLGLARHPSTCAQGIFDKSSFHLLGNDFVFGGLGCKSSALITGAKPFQLL